MPGRPVWLVRHILLVMFLLDRNWPVLDIIATFSEMFPDVRIGRTENSIDYCWKTHLRRGAYNLGAFWADADPMSPQGKIGYLMGLHALQQFSYTEMARRVQERFSTHRWPEGFSREEAVEIAVITYHEYAQYSGRTSLIDKYPVANGLVSSWVINCYQSVIPPEYIQGTIPPVVDLNGNSSPPIALDDVIFILARFVPGFADRYRLGVPTLSNEAFMLQ